MKNDRIFDNKFLLIYGAFFILTVVWVVVLFSVDTLRFGDGWLDYLVVKSLSLHMFGSSAGGLSEWHPFVFPPLLFHMAGKYVPQGPDYLLAHTIVWVSYFVVLLVPLQRRLAPMAATLFLSVSFLFINFPAPIWLGFAESDMLCYAIFYNRYLDVLWGGVFLLFFFDRQKTSLADLFLAGYLLLVAYFSKLSYLAGFGIVFSGMVIFGRHREYLWPMIFTAIVGLAYEPFGHLLHNNYDLLLARSGERGLGGLFKMRMFIPGVLLPACFSLVMSNKDKRYYLYGMAGLAFLVSLMHLGNHNDLGVVPFAFLSVCIAVRFLPELRSMLISQQRRGTVAGYLVAASLGYIVWVGLLLPGAKAISSAVGVINDLTIRDDRVVLPEIPGFFISGDRLTRYDLASSRLPADIKSFVAGKEISALISYLKMHGEYRYFVNIYPSLFPVFSAGATVLPNARAWIATYEFRDGGSEYRSLQSARADFVIERNCEVSPSIPETCYVITSLAREK